MTGMNSSSSRPQQHPGIDRLDVADEAELGVAEPGADQAAVLAADSDGVVAVDVDRADDLRVDLADQHHAGDVDGLGIGDAQAVAELGLLAEPRHQVADLRAAAVHDDRSHADQAHQHDVFGEQRQRVVLARAGERVAAVLDDDDLAGEAPDVGQRLDEGRRLLGRPPGCRVDAALHGHPTVGQAGRLVEAEGDVGGLHRAAAGSLGEIVEGGDRDHGLRAGVVAGGHVHGVRAERRLRRRASRR